MNRYWAALSARHAARMLAAGGIFALAGCRLPALKGPEPTALSALPADFNGTATADSSARLRVEEFFTDPLLINLIGEAVANNLDLKILSQDIDAAGFELLARRGAILPRVSVRAEAGVERSSKFTRDGYADELLVLDDRRLPNPLPDFLLGVDASWQVDIWRQLRNARDAAGLRVLATTDGRTFAVTRLVADIADNYYALLALDQRLATLDQIIATQEQSLRVATSLRDAGRATELGVQRFTAEVRRNRSEKLLVQQEIVERENRINFLAGRFPQPVARSSANFLDLELPAVCVGVPAQLLANRPDIRRAERELVAAGLEVQVARADFYPSLDITAGLGFRAFHPRFLFRPETFVMNAAGGLVAPVINRRAIEAAYQTANARQLQALYDYQRVILDAVTEVTTRLQGVDNFGKSIGMRREQLKALDTSVEVAGKLFQNARAEYSEVLFATRDLLDARLQLIETKRQQLQAVVFAYQALGGGGAPPLAVKVTPASTLPIPVVPPRSNNVAPPPGGPPLGGVGPKPADAGKDKPQPIAIPPGSLPPAFAK
jgi:NodT family efflux transporter outer membrane factor (OMF) lipoprotein